MNCGTNTQQHPHAETVVTFARLFPPNPIKHGRVTGRETATGKKQVRTLDRVPVTRQAIETHLSANGKMSGHSLGYLPGGHDGTPVGAIDLDGKDFPGEKMQEARLGLLGVCADLRLKAYPERSVSGKGWHVWVWADEPLAYGVMRGALREIVHRTGLPPSTETYPMGDNAAGRWIITPYNRALQGQAPYLGQTYLEDAIGQPIPVDELEDWITPNPAARLRELADAEAARSQAHTAVVRSEDAQSDGEFLPEAVNILLEVARANAPGSRHDALAAFLNVAQRAENLADMVDGLKKQDIFSLWCGDGSRTPREWADEIDRWAVSVANGDSGNRRGLPYLKEMGFSIPDLPRLQHTSAYPQIIVSGRQLRDIAGDAVRALLAQNEPPRLFERAGKLVRLIDNGETRVKMLDAVALKGELARCADFVREEQRRGAANYTIPARPPADVAPDLLARVDQLGFPQLRLLTTTPVYSPNGALIAAEGYDSDSGVFLAVHGFQLPALPHAGEGLELLRELLHDFPFVHRAGFAHTLAALLLPFMRPMIDGPTPLHLVETPTQGTGKGLLAEVIPLVALGTGAGVMVQPKDGDEFEKRVTSMLLEGCRVILLDNVHALSGEALAAALTARKWRGRRLGKSEMLTLTNDALWLATGNNVRLDDDMPRRIIPIRLDAGVERPENRTGFKHPDLLPWIREHRPQLVAACLSLVEAWKAAGRPAGVARLGSYESWAAIIGGVLEVAGVQGFLEGREHLYKISNPEPEEWGRMLEAVHDAHGQKPIPASAFLAFMMELGTHVELWEGRKLLSQRQRVGHALLHHRDRIFAGRRLRVAGIDPSTKNKVYRVEVLPLPGVAGVPAATILGTPGRK